MRSKSHSATAASKPAAAPPVIVSETISPVRLCKYRQALVRACQGLRSPYKFLLIWERLLPQNEAALKLCPEWKSSSSKGSSQELSRFFHCDIDGAKLSGSCEKWPFQIRSLPQYREDNKIAQHLEPLGIPFFSRGQISHEMSYPKAEVNDISKGAHARKVHDRICEVFPPSTPESKVAAQRLADNDCVGIDIGG